MKDPRSVGQVYAYALREGDWILSVTAQQIPVLLHVSKIEIFWDVHNRQWRKIHAEGPAASEVRIEILAEEFVVRVDL